MASLNVIIYVHLIVIYNIIVLYKTVHSIQNIQYFFPQIVSPCGLRQQAKNIILIFIQIIEFNYIIHSEIRYTSM